MKQITIIAILLFLFPSCLQKTFTLEDIRTNAKESKSIFSLLVNQKNQPIIEEFYNGKKVTDLVNVQSVTKSIMALLIGIAIDEGHIKSADESIKLYFPDFFMGNKSQNAAITIQHLMDQTSGLEWEGFTEIEKWQKSANTTQYMLEKETITEPGKVYNYNSGATHLLSPILEKATGKSILEYANEKLFMPLGIESVDWKKLNDGYYDASGLSLSMRSTDLQKIAKLLLAKGNFNGKTIISKKWINHVFSKNKKNKSHWGLRGSKYASSWYTTEFIGEEVHYAMGYGGQYIFIIPNLDATIVANHEHDTPKGIEQSTYFIENILIGLMQNLKESKATL